MISTIAPKNPSAIALAPSRKGDISTKYGSISVRFLIWNDYSTAIFLPDAVLQQALILFFFVSFFDDLSPQYVRICPILTHFDR